MTTTNLSRNIFVPVKECGSVIIRDTKGKFQIVSPDKRDKNPVLDWNLCFYTCLMHHLKDKMVPDFWRKLSIMYSPKIDPSLILMKFKKYLTSSLPYANVFTGKEDPSNVGSACDHRVIQKAATVFKVNIYILHGGNKIYHFHPQYAESTSTMCLFFNKFHYRLIEDETYKDNLIFLLKYPDRIDEIYKPYTSYKKRAFTTAVKRGTKK